MFPPTVPLIISFLEVHVIQFIVLASRKINSSNSNYVVGSGASNTSLAPCQVSVKWRKHGASSVAQSGSPTLPTVRQLRKNLLRRGFALTLMAAQRVKTLLGLRVSAITHDQDCEAGYVVPTLLTQTSTARATQRRSPSARAFDF